MKFWKDIMSPLMPIVGSLFGPVGGAIGGAIGGIGQKGNTFQNMLGGGLQGALGGFLGGGKGSGLMSLFGGRNQFGKSAMWGPMMGMGGRKSMLSPFKGFFGNSGSGSVSSLMDNFNLPSISKPRGMGSFNSLFGNSNGMSGWNSNFSQNRNLKF